MRRQPEAASKSAQSREAILGAALREFAEEGYAGARTDRIARAARVNAALLFYYFSNKDRLYGAVLEKIFADWSAMVSKSLDGPLSPEQKLMNFVSVYFDFVAAVPSRPRLVQQEMMRSGRSGSPHIRRLARKYIKPMHLRLRQVIRQGIARGVFHRVDPEHTVYSITGMVNFYFASSPVIVLLSEHDPLARKSIQRRKAEVTKLIRNAVIRAGKERRPK